jgi:hypothetical protein
MRMNPFVMMTTWPSEIKKRMLIFFIVQGSKIYERKRNEQASSCSGPLQKILF